jgi:predicted phage tail protein
MDDRQPDRVVAGVAMTPVTDPSHLTTQALQREVAALEKLLDQRINGIEQAVKVAHENLVRVPTDVDKSISHLREVMNGKLDTVDEKFASVQTQFRERDVRVEQTAKDSKVAIDAALSAQVKSGEQTNASFGLSIAKSEAATTKQIDQLQQIIASNDRSNNDKIDDLKERMNRFEGEGRGKVAATAERATSSASSVGIIGLILGSAIGVIGIVVAIISRWAH